MLATWAVRYYTCVMWSFFHVLVGSAEEEGRKERTNERTVPRFAGPRERPAIETARKKRFWSNLRERESCVRRESGVQLGQEASTFSVESIHAHVQEAKKKIADFCFLLRKLASSSTFFQLHYFPLKSFGRLAFLVL